MHTIVQALGILCVIYLTKAILGGLWQGFLRWLNDMSDEEFVGCIEFKRLSDATFGPDWCAD